MLQLLSVIPVRDNSGVLKVRMIRCLTRKGRDNQAYIGDIVRASVISKRGNVFKKGQLVEVLIVNTVFPFTDELGIKTIFSANGCILIQREKRSLSPVGTRVLCPVLRKTMGIFNEKSYKVFSKII